MKQPLNEQFIRMQKLAGIITEDKFYSRNYIKQKYKAKAKEIEDNIEDEMDNNPNIWDLYTSLETPKEVDNFIKGFLNENQINENLNFDYQERKSGDVIVMDDKTMDDILDDLELQDYINPKSFTRNNKGEIVLGVDHMDYEQFDKLAKFLGIKY
jgi:hypothetical protein